MRQIEKIVMLQTLDSLWKDHLLAMDHLKESIGLRGYAQLNPLVEYQKEGFSMFEALMATMQADVVEKVFRCRPCASRACSNSNSSSRPQRVVMSHGGQTEQAPAGAPPGGSKTRGRQGRPQRSVSVRLGQEIQALPRQVGLQRTSAADFSYFLPAVSSRRALAGFSVPFSEVDIKKSLRVDPSLRQRSVQDDNK